jgi:hypothetical protein
MARARFLVAATILGIGCLFLPLAHSQPAQEKGTYRLEPVAETRLLMEGLASPNLRGLGKLLTDKPTDTEAWAFARGQALLVAETGNLLLMRPPRGRAEQELWMKHASELRAAAADLARAAAARDYAKSRVGLAASANSCNRCHQSFGVAERVDPFSGD